jgi:DivIVA domain-containing protein
VSTETSEFIALDPSEDPVAEIASPSFPPAFRGYDRHAVDEYVIRVTEIVAELHASRSPRAAVKRALDRVGRETASILQNARETADDITLQSRTRAEERRQEAEREAGRLRAEAEAHVRALDAATDEIWVERRRIVESTHQLGERLQGIAAAAAADFPADGEGDGDGRRTGPRPAAEDRPKSEEKDEEKADEKSENRAAEKAHAQP